jgi:hypothetical protein
MGNELLKLLRNVENVPKKYHSNTLTSSFTALTAPGATSFIRDRESVPHHPDNTGLVDDARLFLADALGASERQDLFGMEEKVLKVCQEKQPKVEDGRIPLLWMPIYYESMNNWKGMAFHKGLFDDIDARDGDDLIPYYTIRQDKKVRFSLTSVSKLKPRKLSNN